MTKSQELAQKRQADQAARIICKGAIWISVVVTLTLCATLGGALVYWAGSMWHDIVRNYLPVTGTLGDVMAYAGYVLFAGQFARELFRGAPRLWQQVQGYIAAIK